MPTNDIGIDLGTTSVLIYDSQMNLLLCEPSIVAYDVRSGEVFAAGLEARKMLGRTPARICACRPLSNGVISDFDKTGEMIKYFLRRIYSNSIMKPRVIVCVPSGITEVESDAVVSAFTDAGARKVYLIEEPVAAALGAGLDISKPEGNLILDIGGGTSDIAVLSFNGIVCKSSLRIAGRTLDDRIIRYVRGKHNLLIGDSMAEQAKINCGSVMFTPDEDCEYEVKGRNLHTGLPARLTITRSELSDVLCEPVMQIVDALKKILEITPPELSADLHQNGITLTGGSAQLHGLDRLLAEQTRLPVHKVENPAECVGRGTTIAFQYLETLSDGFLRKATHFH